MVADGGRLKVGASALALGVRMPPNDHPDIAVDAEGKVEPQTGGMSVAPGVATVAGASDTAPTAREGSAGRREE